MSEEKVNNEPVEIDCPKMTSNQEVYPPYPSHLAGLFNSDASGFGSRKFASPVDTLSMNDMMTFMCSEDEKRTFGDPRGEVSMDNMLDDLVRQRDQDAKQWRSMMDKKLANEDRKNNFQEHVRKEVCPTNNTTGFSQNTEERIERMERRLESMDNKLDSLLQNLSSLTLSILQEETKSHKQDVQMFKNLFQYGADSDSDSNDQEQTPQSCHTDGNDGYCKV